MDTTNGSTLVSENSSGTSYTTSTTDGQTYYWKIAVGDGYENSTNTTVYQFTENTAPTVPTYDSPTNNSRNTGNSITLDANSSDAEGDSLTYYFYMDTTNGSTFLGSNSSGDTYTNATVDGSTYYWKVKVGDGYENSTNTTVYQFTENTKPPAPTHSSPSDGARVTGNSQTISWAAGGTDNEGDTITYYWFIDNESTPTTPYVCSGSTTGTSSSACPTTDGQTYYWNVIASDGYENQTATDVWNFTEKPTLSSPANASYISATSQDLVTNSVTDDEGDTITYHFYLDSIDATTLVNSTTSTTHPASGLSDGTTYYWKVVADDSYENGTASNVWQFTIDTTEPVIVESSCSVSPSTITSSSTANVDITCNVTDTGGSGVDIVIATLKAGHGGTAFRNVTLTDTGCGNAAGNNQYCGQWAPSSDWQDTEASDVYIDIFANDSVGNSNSSSEVSGLTIDIDDTPPSVVTSGPNGTITDTTPTLSVTTSESGICKFDVAAVSFDSMTYTMSGTGTTHSYTLPALTEAKTYSYHVRCNDSAGNVMNPFVISFTLNMTLSISIVNPTEGSTHSGNVLINISVTNASTTVDTVQYRVWTEGRPDEYVWRSATYDATSGYYQATLNVSVYMNNTQLILEARVNDTEGNTAETGSWRVKFKVDSSTKYDQYMTIEWNRIMLPPMTLSDNSTSAVFSSLSGNYEVIWWYYNATLPTAGWKSYSPGDPFPDLSEVETGESYWIDMNATDRFYY
jgi:hypothetical protein